MNPNGFKDKGPKSTFNGRWFWREREWEEVVFFVGGFGVWGE